jgi:anti-sigma factor RsiW
MTTIAPRSRPAPSAGGLPAACAQARANLSAFVDGEVSTGDAADVLAHVSQCPRCRSAERGLRTLIDALQRSQLPVLASRRLRLRVEQLLAEHRDG